MENKIQKILDKYSDVSLDPKQLENKEEELIPLLFSKVSQMPELVLKSSETLNENTCLPKKMYNQKFYTLFQKMILPLLQKFQIQNPNLYKNN